MATKTKIVAKPIHSKLMLSVNKLRDSRTMVEEYIKDKGLPAIKADPYVVMLAKDADKEMKKIKELLELN